MTNPQYVFQSTLQYSTFIKRALVEALAAAFEGHPSQTVAQTSVRIDFTQEEADYPAVIVKLFEREMPNAGLGHFEILPVPGSNSDTPLYNKHYRRYYKGDVSFDVYALDISDRDVIRDALVEVLVAQDVAQPGMNFLNRFRYDVDGTPYGPWHMVYLNQDLIVGYGEQQTAPGWLSEDRLLFQVTYRVPIFGEYLTAPPVLPNSPGVVEEIDVYPWIPDIDAAPTNPPLGGDPNSISGGIYKYTGSRTGTKDI